MAHKMYTLGEARRFVAGNIWCAQGKNLGKLPCLRCRGRGTLKGDIVRIGCPDCEVTGYSDSNKEIWEVWFNLWLGQ